MTFAAPWALWGLLLLAGPVLVHLFSRRTATRRMFPTLRFLEAARLPPVSRRTLDDRVLLALRLLIIALAVMAWARPQRLTPPRVDADATTDGAIVLMVDTSASMQRLMSNGTTAMAEARRLADSSAAGVARALRVETADPAAAIGASAAWLHGAGGGALVLFTDAQRGTLVPTDVVALPGSVRLMVRAIPVQGELSAAVRRDTATGLKEALDIHTAQRLRDSSSLIFATDGATVHAPLVMALSGIAEHPLLREIVARFPLESASGAPESVPGWLTVPAAPHPGAAVVGWIRPSHPVVLQLAIDASHPAAAALVTLTRDVLSDAADVPLRERDPVVLDSAQLVALARAAVEGASAGADAAPQDMTDAAVLTPWLWVLVLLALTGEWWLRSRLARVVAHA